MGYIFIFLYELLYEMAIDKFPYLLEKFVKSSVALVKRNQISTWAMWKSDFHMTHEEIILNCCYLTNFLAMQKSDFHMTHVEIIFKLLLFDNFLINVLFF